MKKLFIITTILLFICLLILWILPEEKEQATNNNNNPSTENYEYQNIDTDIDLYNNLSNLYYIKKNHLKDFIVEKKTFLLVVISNNNDSKKFTKKINELLSDSEFYAYVIDEEQMNNIDKTPTILFYEDGIESLKTIKTNKIDKYLKEYNYIK